MKRLWILLLAFTILVYLTGCGLSLNVKTQRQEALNIAQSIPLPPSYYSSKTGNKMIATKIKVHLEDYNTDTGEPEFTFSFRYVDPHRHPTIFQANPNYSEYYLGYPLPADGKVGDSYYAQSPNEWSWTSYQYTISLSELQQHESELVWK
jgi:hypothetical protein